MLTVVELERGLLGMEANGTFLCAEPDGRVTLSKSWCSLWEFFLLSEDLPGAPGDAGAAKDHTYAGFHVNKKWLQSCIVDPRLRARVKKNSKAKKLLIYGYPRWSHGRVYYDLCRHLWDKGYIVDILNWQVSHAAYFSEFTSFYDLFITALDGVGGLVNSYGMAYERIIGLSHHEFDIRMLIEQKGLEAFQRLANYGVVSEFLYSRSIMLGVPRLPKVAPLGINFAEFHMELPSRLETVGYASSMSAKTYGIEWKRGELAEAAAREAGLAFQVAGSTASQISFHDMPDFYRTVDAVVTSSVSEANALPVMEAAAAGRLVIGTPVRNFPRNAYEGAGIIAPIESDKFKEFTAETLRYYKDNPSEFVRKCQDIQKAATKFDWQHMIGDWIELIETSR
jgi:glycosyltransferase involved in cell wall biosynthesis